MPQFIPKVISNPSNLTHGRHPGFLLAIVEEQTPSDWQMAQKSPTMYRWQLAIWEHADHMQQYAPEEQSGLTSTAFSPKAKFQASKCYVWTCSLIGREIPKGQSVDIDPLLPLACWVDIERVPGNDFCKVQALYGRPEGQATIPPIVHQLKAQYATGMPTPAAQTPPPAAYAVTPAGVTPQPTAPAGWPGAARPAQPTQPAQAGQGTAPVPPAWSKADIPF